MVDWICCLDGPVDWMNRLVCKVTAILSSCSNGNEIVLEQVDC